jgi:ketosteroid isomerase-like protein
LLSWWFQPPTGRKDGWNRYFGETEPALRSVGKDTVSTASKKDDAARRESDIASRAALTALLPDSGDELATEDADAATEAFYEFLHAFGRGDIEYAMQFVADDYHVLEDDHEVDRNDLRCRLESLLASLHGYEIDVSLASVPHPLSHPYGVLIYAEIQVEGVRTAEPSRRSVVEHRVVLLQRQGEDGWKIAAMSRPRL